MKFHEKCQKQTRFAKFLKISRENFAFFCRKMRFAGVPHPGCYLLEDTVLNRCAPARSASCSSRISGRWTSALGPWWYTYKPPESHDARCEKNYTKTTDRDYKNSPPSLSLTLSLLLFCNRLFCLMITRTSPKRNTVMHCWYIFRQNITLASLSLPGDSLEICWTLPSRHVLRREMLTISRGFPAKTILRPVNARENVSASQLA